MLHYLEILVTPKSKQQRIIRMPEGKLKCYLINAPEKGKANKELIDLLSKKLSLRKQAIAITHGETSRQKTISIDTHESKQEIIQKLIPHYQTSLLDE